VANTSLSLGDHWEEFVKREVASGRYGSVSEVIRAALRELEERGRRLEVLRKHLDQGVAQAKGGAFAPLSVDDIVSRAKTRSLKK
jgi:antitoxin ParD1/3/4